MSRKKKATSFGILSLIVLGVVAYIAAKSLESLNELDMSDPFEVDFDEE